MHLRVFLKAQNFRAKVNSAADNSMQLQQIPQTLQTLTTQGQHRCSNSISRGNTGAGMNRKLQVLWSGYLHNKQLLRIVDNISIINTTITPIKSISHGLQLLTSGGDIVVPCRECLVKGITETISYVDLNITTKLGQVTIEATIYVLCNGCSGHGTAGEYCIVFYADN